MCIFFRRSKTSVNDSNAAGNITREQYKKMLMIPIIHIVIFFLSWTPYTVLATWWVLDFTFLKFNFYMF